MSMELAVELEKLKEAVEQLRMLVEGGEQTLVPIAGIARPSVARAIKEHLSQNALKGDKGDPGELLVIATNESLPTTNIGPIWADAYNSLMTWQTFNANGANYTGYASVNIGQVAMENTNTPRTGWLKTGTANVSKTTYAPLWNWALHNGLVSATWEAGQGFYAEVSATHFRLPDFRGEFLRFWADGRDADLNRANGSWQAGSILYSNAMHGWLGTPQGEWAEGCTLPDNVWSQTYRHQFGALFDNVTTSSILQAAFMTNSADVSTQTACLGQGTTRPRNTAFLGVIKF